MHKYASPKFFYTLAGQLTPWMATLTALLLVAGLYLGLFIAPADYQQGESYRIMFIHVPAAWMSMFIYVCMAGAGAIALVWNVKLFEMFAGNCAPVGASFTFLALVTGSLWGKPMWGTWWAWDARLTSELILFFLYIGYMALEASIDDPRRAPPRSWRWWAWSTFLSSTSRWSGGIRCISRPRWVKSEHLQSTRACLLRCC